MMFITYTSTVYVAGDGGVLYTRDYMTLTLVFDVRADETNLSDEMSFIIFLLKIRSALYPTQFVRYIVINFR